MKQELIRLEHAADLPPEWDDLAGDYFQERSFLVHTEAFNPCGQRYYLCLGGGKLLAGAVMYSLRLSLLTYPGIKSPLWMQIVGVPCSVSCPGIMGERAGQVSLRKFIYETEQGFILFLNLREGFEDPSTAQGQTLPTILLENRFTDWDQYLDTLRSDYRRRIRKACFPVPDLQMVNMSCSRFSPEMYGQYVSVFRASKARLEFLGQDFFSQLPEPFILSACRLGDKLLGWTISLKSRDTFYFFLGGVDYALNREFHTYYRLLCHLTRMGIGSGARLIDLGQTAEIPKMRMGGKPEARYMEARAHNRLVNFFLKKGERLLEYRRSVPRANVFSS